MDFTGTENLARFFEYENGRKETPFHTSARVLYADFYDAFFQTHDLSTDENSSSIVRIQSKQNDDGHRPVSERK